MKKFLIAATCLSLAVPAVVSAQSNPNWGGKPQQGQVRPPSGGQNRPGPGGGPANPGGNGQNRPGWQGGGGNQAGWQGGGGRPGWQGGGNRLGWQGGQYRGNWSGQRSAWGWNGRRWHGGMWSWPAGYGYQRWVVGSILPGIFLAQSYYFADYAQLGFEAPPWGYQWVRYGPDLVLVNVATGQVADVEYGVFY